MNESAEQMAALERIAADYHLSEDVPDKFIESLCQHYCCDWLEQKIAPTDRVLELGYGDGITLARLAGKPAHYAVLEGARSLVEKVRAAHPDIEVIHGLFESYRPARPHSKVLALHVLEHVDDPLALLHDMRGWLQPGGELIVVVPNSESIHRQLAVLMGLQPRLDTLSPRDKVVGHQRVYDLPTLEQQLRDAGYEILESRGFFMKTLPNGMMLQHSPELIVALNRFGEQLPARMLANLAVRARVAGA